MSSALAAQCVMQWQIPVSVSCPVQLTCCCSKFPVRYRSDSGNYLSDVTFMTQSWFHGCQIETWAYKRRIKKHARTTTRISGLHPHTCRLIQRQCLWPHARTHTQNRRLSVQTHIIVRRSHSSTLTLGLFESPLNNLDLAGSRKTHESPHMMSSGVRGRDCDASTAGAAGSLTIKPDIIHLDLLVQMQNCRETKPPKPETHNGSFSVKLSSPDLFCVAKEWA